MLPSTLALILANLVPLLGALLFGWNIFEVFALYWTESAVIGAFTIVRLLRAGAFLPLFFCIHFGLFLFVHSLAIMALIGAPDGAAHFTDRSAPLRLLTTAASSSHGLGLWALIISHGITFATDQRDRAQGLVAANRLMFAPYRRIERPLAKSSSGFQIHLHHNETRLSVPRSVLKKLKEAHVPTHFQPCG